MFGFSCLQMAMSSVHLPSTSKPASGDSMELSCVLLAHGFGLKVSRVKACMSVFTEQPVQTMPLVLEVG